MAKKKKKSSFWYVFGTMTLVLVLGIYMYSHQDSKLSVNRPDYNKLIKDYVLNKQEIADKIGAIKRVGAAKEISDNHFAVVISGEKSEATLEFTSKADAVNNGVITGIILRAGAQKTNLSPEAVASVSFYAASQSSAPLKNPVYLEGESIIIKSDVLSLSRPGDVVSQTLTVLNENNEVVATKENVASGKVATLGDDLIFTNRLGTLAPGTYHVGLSYKTASNAQKETYWQKLLVRESSDSPFVKSVQYYLDRDLKTKVGAVFDAKSPLFVRLKLDGFKNTKGQVSGVVDLKVTNSEGKLVAQKPKFAAFTQAFDRAKTIVVDGELKLNEPEIYLLSFRIRDHFSKAEITHEEKVVVRLKGTSRL